MIFLLKNTLYTLKKRFEMIFVQKERIQCWILCMGKAYYCMLNFSYFFRLTVDPEGKLWFSNVTRRDSSENFLYACSAASYFRNEYKLGNRVHLQVIQSGSSSGLQNKHEPVQQYVTR